MISNNNSMIRMGISLSAPVPGARRIFSTKKPYMALVLFVLSMTLMFLPDDRATQRKTTAVNEFVASETTIVFGYFALVNSTHPSDQYLEWMKNVMCIEDPVVVFTSPSLVKHFEELRADAEDRTLIVPMDADDLEIGNNDHYDFEYWESQREYDHKGYKGGIARNSEIYKIWLAKTWLVNQALKLNPFHSEKFVYMDIGHFRSEGDLFCGKTIVRHPEVILSDKVVLYPYRALRVDYKDLTRNANPIFSQGFWSHYIAGGMISGGKDAWPRFMDKLEETIREYNKEGVGVFDDQPILLSTCLRNPGLCAVVRWDSLFGYGNGDCTEGGKYRMAKCIENGGWPYGSVSGFFSGKYRLWHGGDIDTMFWDPALGTPTEEEDPGLYSDIPKAISKV